jgi:cell division protein FtsB
MEGIDALHDRVNALLKRFGSLTRERESLKKELNSMRAENEELRAQLRQAEEGLLALQISQSMPDAAVREQSRKKLDAVIGEIDKILTTLND